MKPTIITLVFLLSTSVFGQLFESYKLFEDKFESKVSDAWQPKSGNWKIQNGKYFQMENNDHALCVLNGKDWNDIITRFKVQLVNGDAAKIYFRYNEKSHYVLELNEDRTQSAFKYVENGKEKLLSEVDFGMDDDFHFVMIQTIEDRINIWIDSRNYVVSTIKKASNGTIAIGTQNGQAWFDDIIVYKAKMN